MKHQQTLFSQEERSSGSVAPGKEPMVYGCIADKQGSAWKQEET